MGVDKRPTINDVAARAAVSKSTVSLVLRDSPLVKEETRAAVHAAMRALGYVRNRAAATLRGSGTGLVGLVINDLRNPFFTEFAASVQMTLAERGFATVIANCDENPEVQNRTIQTMLEHDVAGLVISPCYGDVTIGFEAILRAGLPALQVLRRVTSGGGSLPFFSHDYAAGGHMAVRHFLDQGIEKIAFVGGIQERDITAERMSGYLSEMQAHGLQPVVLPGPSTRSFGRMVVGRLLQDYPDIEAAICFNDLVALGMYAGLNEAGRAPGKDYFIIGFDDIEEARLAHPPLSTVRCDVTHFGVLSAKRLLSMIEKDEPDDCPDTLPVTLMARGSSRKCSTSSG